MARPALVEMNAGVLGHGFLCRRPALGARDRRHDGCRPFRIVAHGPPQTGTDLGECSPSLFGTASLRLNGFRVSRKTLRIEVSFRRPCAELMLPPSRGRWTVAAPHRRAVKEHPGVPSRDRETEHGIESPAHDLSPVPIMPRPMIGDQPRGTRHVGLARTQFVRPHDVDDHIRVRVLGEPRSHDLRSTPEALPSRRGGEKDGPDVPGIAIECGLKRRSGRQHLMGDRGAAAATRSHDEEKRPERPRGVEERFHSHPRRTRTSRAANQIAAPDHMTILTTRGAHREDARGASSITHASRGR